MQSYFGILVSCEKKWYIKYSDLFYNGQFDRNFTFNNMKLFFPLFGLFYFASIDAQPMARWTCVPYGCVRYDGTPEIGKQFF